MNEKRIAQPVGTWERIDGVDLLRGLAIAFVLLNHVNMQLLFAKVPFAVGLPAQVDLSLFWNGQQGVQMFFVVSGFLITSTSMRRWKTPGQMQVGQFYKLRFARIAPLFLCLLLVLSVLHLAHVPEFVVQPKTGGLPRALLAALTFHINWLEAYRDYLPGAWDILWSLSVEEMFYLFFPLVARLLPRREVLLLTLGAFIVAGPFARAKAFDHNPVWREYSYLGSMDAIALGCLTAMLLPHTLRSKAAVRITGWVGALLLCFSLCGSSVAYRWGWGRSGVYMSVLALGTALVIAAAAKSQWQAPAALHWLKVLGQRSYEIYLTHMFSLLGLFALYQHWGKPVRAVPLLCVLVIAVAGLGGWLVGVLFAEPVNLRLRERLAVGRSVVAAATPAVD